MNSTLKHIGENQQKTVISKEQNYVEKKQII